MGNRAWLEVNETITVYCRKTFRRSPHTETFVDCVDVAHLQVDPSEFGFCVAQRGFLLLTYLRWLANAEIQASQQGFKMTYIENILNEALLDPYRRSGYHPYPHADNPLCCMYKVI